MNVDLWKYDDLEMTVLCCLFLHPEFMESTILEEKHFKTKSAVWIYMKSFYERFKTFDLALMLSMSKQKNSILKTIMALMDYDPIGSHFKLYEQRLVEKYDESEKENWIREKTFEVTTDYYFKKITKKEYEDALIGINKTADELFKRG